MDVSIRSKIYNDVELFKQDNGHWILDAWQLSSGEHETCLNDILLDQTGMFYNQHKNSIAADYRMPSGWVRFSMVYSPGGMDCWRGFGVPQYTMTYHDNVQIYNAKVPENFCSLGFFIKRELLETDERFVPFRAETPNALSSILPDLQTEISIIKDIVAFFYSLNRGEFLTTSPHFESRVHDSVLNKLTTLFEASAGEDVQPKLRLIRRYGMVRQAQKFIEGNLLDPITMGMVADVAGVSVRVLQYAFRDVLGVTPLRYLLTCRLHLVKRRLHAGESEQLGIKSIVAQCGFTHYARFSQQYRRLFHETASETVGRSKKS